MKIVKVNENQSLFDFAIQTAGEASAAFELAILNGLSVTEDLVVGREQILSAAANREIANYYSNRQLQPATGITDESWNNIWSDGFDGTFDREKRIFDYTFFTIFN